MHILQNEDYTIHTKELGIIHTKNYTQYILWIYTYYKLRTTHNTYQGTRHNPHEELHTVHTKELHILQTKDYKQYIPRTYAQYTVRTTHNTY